jgi:integrase
VDESALVRTSSELLPPEGPPADRNPVNVYLGRLRSERARTVQLGALETVAGFLLGGVDRGQARRLAWWMLRYQHTQAVRTALIEVYAPATAERLLSAVRGVLEESWNLGLMRQDDYARAIKLKPVRASTLLHGRALTAGELRALFQACSKNGVLGARDAALLSICYGAGLRRAEAVALDLEDFDAETGTLLVRHGKGDKARTVYATHGGRLAILAWLARRGIETGPLLLAVAKGGKLVPRRLSPQAVFKALAALAGRAGVAAFGPHDLRRSFISDLLDNGADLSTVAKLAGHAQVETTARYDRRPEEAKRRAASLLHVPYESESARPITPEGGASARVK